MSAGRETEHWPEIYHTANGYKVQCECGWDSKSIKGANPDEGLKVMWKEHVAALREPGADTGTTPPEGLDAGVRAALECAEYALTHPGSNQHFALTAVRHVMAELDAAATQRAPVEQASVTDAVKLSGVGERHQLPGKARQQGSEGTPEREAATRTLPTDCIPETGAPDHAREGARASALKDACAAICNGCAQGHPIVSDPMDEEHEELHDWGFTKQPCAAWKIRKLLEEALADGKEGGE